MFYSIWQYALAFLNSTFFLALVGLAAYGVYRKQRSDSKKDAASIILLEVENAERQLQKIDRDSPFTSPQHESTFLMKTGSWDKYKHLFVRHFDRNEWDKITDFYNKCAWFDEAVSYQYALFNQNVREIGANSHRILADHAETYSQEIEGKSDAQLLALEAAYLAKRNRFLNIYIKPGQIHLYYPDQPVNAAKGVLGSIETSLSLTSVGGKLKSLATRVSFWGRFSRHR